MYIFKGIRYKEPKKLSKKQRQKDIICCNCFR